MTYPSHGLIADEMLQDLHGRRCQEIDGVRITQSHGQVPEDLLLAALNAVEEALELSGALHVHVFLPDARVQAPRELVAGVHGDDVLDFEIVKGHEQLRAQRAVMDVASTQKKSS